MKLSMTCWVWIEFVGPIDYPRLFGSGWLGSERHHNLMVITVKEKHYVFFLINRYSTFHRGPQSVQAMFP